VDIHSTEDHRLADKIKKGGIRWRRPRLAVLQAEIKAQMQEIEGIYTQD